MDHRRKCGEISLHKMYHTAHLLLVIGGDVMKLAFATYAMSLTRCWAQEEMNMTAFQDVQCCSQSVGHNTRYDKTFLHKICNVTHSLLVMW
jgi:hypothetical protein